MKYRLRKDLVIKAGTVFDTAPTKVVRAVPFIEHIHGFGKDNWGSFTVPMDDPAMLRWFEPVQTKKGK